MDLFEELGEITRPPIDITSYITEALEKYGNATCQRDIQVIHGEFTIDIILLISTYETCVSRGDDLQPPDYDQETNVDVRVIVTNEFGDELDNMIYYDEEIIDNFF